ncbi:hypothetical protein RhiirA1_443008 [Rhizophagus irregularis]|uniref:Uncharacterized protein n=1 Tax=Rhizophagus irregularis TaxID=588596 RepID=A0A2N0RLB4_9GLOM|nr:hypothetical protein RhiirA1_443008 [Rhizophagus irregularis]
MWLKNLNSGYFRQCYTALSWVNNPEAKELFDFSNPFLKLPDRRILGGDILKQVVADADKAMETALKEDPVANVQVKKSLKSVPIKRKQNAQSSSSKKRSKKAIVINSYTEDHDDNDDKIDKENKSFSKLNELEYQERVLALKERKIALREREADIRIME